MNGRKGQHRNVIKRSLEMAQDSFVRIIFNPFVSGLHCGTAARVLLQGAQLSEQLSPCRPDKLPPGEELCVRDIGNQLLTKEEGK
jgi:hypothetical protein